MTVLTPRQCEILQLLANGFNYKEIGIILEISPHTIKNHMYDIGLRLGTSGHMQAVMYAASLGLVDLAIAQKSVASRVKSNLY